MSPKFGTGRSSRTRPDIEACDGGTKAPEHVLLARMVPFAHDEASAAHHVADGAPAGPEDRRVEYVRERPVQAEAHLERCIALWTSTGRGGEDELASMRYMLGLVREATGRMEEAEIVHESALRLRESALGPDHIQTLRSRMALARVIGRRGDTRTAIDQLAAIVATSRRVFGPDHLHTYQFVVTLARVELESGDFASAERHATEALAIVEPIYEPDHAALSDPLEIMGLARLGLERDADGIAPLVRALAILRAVYGEDQDHVPTILVNLAAARREIGDHEAALADARAALALAERHGDDAFAQLARVELAECLDAAGHRDEAEVLAAALVPALERSGQREDAARLRGLLRGRSPRQSSR